MTSTLPPLIQACSGAIGSAAANSATYPLDLVTTRLQTTNSKQVRGLVGAVHLLRQIVRKHGFSALYDGLVSDTGATILSNFFYFYFYSFLRKAVFSRKPSLSKEDAKSVISIFEELALGLIAGISSRAISTPLSIVTIRMQTERDAEDRDVPVDGPDGVPDSGLFSVIRHIHEEDGILGFWRGFGTAIPLALNPALTFLFFQLLRRLSPRDVPTPGQAFLLGAFSNSMALTILYPLVLAKARIQAARKRSGAKPSMMDVWDRQMHREGFYGLYQGIETNVAKGIISQGLTMMIKTRIEQLVTRAYLRRMGRV